MYALLNNMYHTTTTMWGLHGYTTGLHGNAMRGAGHHG